MKLIVKFYITTSFDAADTDVVNDNLDITSKFTDPTFRNKVFIDRKNKFVANSLF